MEAELGPDHPDLAAALDALGAIDYDAGQFADAQRSYKRALAILDKLGEPATYNTTEAIEGLGNTALALGHVDDARKNYDRALALYRAAYGPSHPQVAVALRQRAQLEMGTQAAIDDLE